MRFIMDTEGGEWAATVSPHGLVRVLRQTTKPPYREGGDPTLEYQTVEMLAADARAFGRALVGAASSAINGDAGERS